MPYRHRAAALMALAALSGPLMAGEQGPADRLAGRPGQVNAEAAAVPAPDAESRALAAAFRARYLRPRVAAPAARHGDGSLSRGLGPREAMYTVARFGADGKLEIQCLPVRGAARFLERADAAADTASAN